MVDEAMLSGSTFGSAQELALIRDAARGFFEHSWLTQPSLEAATLTKVWRDACAQGWSTVCIHDAEAGLASGLMFIEESGRAACPLPVLDSILLSSILASATDDSAGVWRAAVGSGEVIPAFVLPEPGNSAEVPHLHANSGSINGLFRFVEHAGTATHFVIPVDSFRRIAIVAADAPGLQVTFTPGLSVPPLADIALTKVMPDALFASSLDFSMLVPLARLMLSARALGAAAKGMEMLTEYAKVRRQFGKLIGQYQAIQHKLANCLIGLEVCRLSILRAGASVSSDNLLYAASVASANCGQLLRQICLEIHHGFGGVSFWEDHEMPRHFRRVHADLTRYGGVHAAREEIAGHLLDDAA